MPTPHYADSTDRYCAVRGRAETTIVADTAVPGVQEPCFASKVIHSTLTLLVLLWAVCSESESGRGRRFSFYCGCPSSIASCGTVGGSPAPPCSSSGFS